MHIPHLSTKTSASEIKRKFIKSASSLVGYVLLRGTHNLVLQGGKSFKSASSLVGYVLRGATLPPKEGSLLRGALLVG